MDSKSSISPLPLRFKTQSFALCLICGLSTHPCWASTGSRTFTENFSRPDQADRGQSTGFWDSSAGIARAAVLTGGDLTKPIDFGRGGDGDLISGTGYTFDTDAHPSYEFRTISITAGNVIIVGTHPLIIRALGAVTIQPVINLSGGVGGNGTSATQATPLTGGNSGTAVTSLAGGGPGGISRDVTSVDREGLRGLLSTGIEWTFISRSKGNVLLAEGIPVSAQDGASAQDGSGSTSGDFDTAGAFVAGGGGGAGGAYLNVASGSLKAAGAGGGAGGGVIHIIAAGPIALGASIGAPTILARGGKGGDRQASPAAASISECSGSGGGGAGGAVWLQSLQTVSMTSTPLVTGGSTGAGILPCATGTQGPGLDGIRRGDQNTGGTAWSDTSTCGGLAGCSTSPAAPNQTYSILSKPYDLKTFNAFFPESPTLTQTLNGGAIQVLYSGSEDGVSFGGETPTLSDLSYKNYGFLRLKILISTAIVLGASPNVHQIAFTYDDAGPNRLDIGLGVGCGSLRGLPWNQNPEKNTGRPTLEKSLGSNSARTAFLLFTAGFFGLWAFQRGKATNSESL